MSTHEYRCIVCDEFTTCSAEEHALGCGDGGCYRQGPLIEFCSLKCFDELIRRMKVRRAIYQENLANDVLERANVR